MTKRITVPEGKVAPVLTYGQLGLLIAIVRDERRRRAKTDEENEAAYLAVIELTLLDAQGGF